jgi:predicted nucleic acid-binding protein
MIVLDTNVIFETSKPAPAPRLVEWLSSMPPDRLFLTQVTISELFYGGERYRLKTGSLRYLNSAARLVEQEYSGRILPWNATEAIMTGNIRARREMSGFSIIMQDAMIAAICLQHGATLATRNTKDFEGA